MRSLERPYEGNASDITDFREVLVANATLCAAKRACILILAAQSRLAEAELEVTGSESAIGGR
jgi:hypothetical protein